MDSNKDIKPLKRQFDFTDVPSWYVLCTNNQCPMQTSCLRFLAAQNAPDHLEIATCVMPKTLKGGQCRWYDKRTVVVWAAGFSRLYDCVMKKDRFKYMFYQDIYRASDEQLCFRATVELVCLINGQLGNSPEYDEAFKDYI